MNDDHEHDRYLRCEEDWMIFGCINPFCCHGELGLPNYHKIPLETQAVIVKVKKHKGRKVTFELRLKRQIGSHKLGELVILEANDNLEDCKNAFNSLFKG